MKRIFILIISLTVIFSLCSCNTQARQDLHKTSTAGGKVWPTEAWSISTPEEQGLDSERLAKADTLIKQIHPSVYSLLVIRHGYLVYEKYYCGATADTANPVYSVTKSFMSALTGIAIQQKLIKSLDQPVDDLVPDYFKNIDDPRKKGITIQNVLTMTGGLQSIDDNFGAYYLSPDWFRYALEKPFINNLETKFVYNTGLTQSLSNILTKVSGMDTKRYAEKYLTSTIGINIVSWDHDSNGFYGGGSGLHLTPRDMAKFGYLYLNCGQWNGKQVIPKAWVEESTQKHISADHGCDYGYLFWLSTVHNAAKNVDYRIYCANGSGGQQIVVAPGLDMITVITANAALTPKDDYSIYNIFKDYVFPAVQ